MRLIHSILVYPNVYASYYVLSTLIHSILVYPNVYAIYYVLSTRFFSILVCMLHQSQQFRSKFWRRRAATLVPVLSSTVTSPRRCWLMEPTWPASFVPSFRQPRPNFNIKVCNIKIFPKYWARLLIKIVLSTG